MKTLLKILLVAVSIAALGYACNIGYAFWEFRPRQVILPAQTQQPLTEEQAVALSREVLLQLGEDITKFTPRAYDGTKLYARNTLNSSSGYVLWASEDSHPGFSVHLEQKGEAIHCGVSRCK